jgi:hypothetical protein
LSLGLFEFAGRFSPGAQRGFWRFSSVDFGQRGPLDKFGSRRRLWTLMDVNMLTDRLEISGTRQIGENPSRRHRSL